MNLRYQNHHRTYALVRYMACVTTYLIFLEKMVTRPSNQHLMVVLKTHFYISLEGHMKIDLSFKEQN